jgi:hypothetical protein
MDTQHVATPCTALPLDSGSASLRGEHKPQSCLYRRHRSLPAEGTTAQASRLFRGARAQHQTAKLEDGREWCNAHAATHTHRPFAPRWSMTPPWTPPWHVATTQQPVTLEPGEQAWRRQGGNATHATSRNPHRRPIQRLPAGGAPVAAGDAPLLLQCACACETEHLTGCTWSPRPAPLPCAVLLSRPASPTSTPAVHHQPS